MISDVRHPMMVYDTNLMAFVLWDGSLTTGALTIGTVNQGAAGVAAWLVAETDYIVRLDEASSTITYVGSAAPGSADAAAVWQIKRLDSTSGLVVLFAGGVATFTQIWNDRAGLSYS